MSKSNIIIKALQVGDIPAAAQIAADSFEKDRQTEMKALGQDPFDMAEYTISSMPGYLKHPRCIVLKAEDPETGDVMGVCNWGFRGLPPSEMPAVEGRTQPPADPPSAEGEARATSRGKSEEEEEPQASDADPIKRLEALTNADMNAWMEEVMPDGAKCMYVVGLNVAPKYQGRGVGSALLRWGTSVCDDKGIFAWVHSSEGAWKMYHKCGFQVIRELDLDLDEYAPCPPPGEGEGAKWGHYVFRYMKYPAKSSA